MGDRDLDRWDVGVGERDRRAASSFEPGIREKISQNRIIPIRAGVGGAHGTGDYRIERGKWPFPPYRASTCGLGWEIWLLPYSVRNDRLPWQICLVPLSRSVKLAAKIRDAVRYLYPQEACTLRAELLRLCAQFVNIQSQRARQLL